MRVYTVQVIVIGIAGYEAQPVRLRVPDLDGLDHDIHFHCS